MDSRSPRRWLRPGLLAALGLILLAPGSARAQSGWRARRVRGVVPVSSPRVAGLAPSPMLGQFYPDAYLNVRGNFAAGGGYSPLGTYGDSTAVMYGPLSSFRAVSAPVLYYQRGYDGSTRADVGTGFSTPNFPPASRVVYPSRANAVGAPRRVTTPPQWDSGINFIDMN